MSDTILIMSNGSKWKPSTSSDTVHCVNCENAVDLNYFFPGMGTIASAAIGAGSQAPIQGESFGSAAMGGLTAGVMSGVSGALGSIGNQGQTGGAFMSGLKGALPSQTTKGSLNLSFR